MIFSNNTLCLWRKSFIIIPLNIFTNHRILFIKTQVIVLIDIMKGLASLSIPHSWLWMIQITVCARILSSQPADICSLSTCTLTKTNAGYFFWSWPWKSCQSPIYVYFFSDFRKKNSFHLALPGWWYKVCFYFPLPPLSDTEAEPWIHRYHRPAVSVLCLPTTQKPALLAKVTM